MVTKAEYISNGKYMGAETFYGLSTDSKPTSCGNGSFFIAVDNIGKADVNSVYCFDAENSTWYPVESDETDAENASNESNAESEG